MTNMKDPSHSLQAVALVALWCTFPLLPWWSGVLLAAGVALLLRARPRALRAALLPGILSGLAALPELMALWPLPLFFALIVLVLPGLRTRLAWGDLRPWRWILGLWVLVAVALPAWLLILQPDLSAIVDRLPDAGWATIVALGLLFAGANALAEELAWRHVLWEGLEGAPQPAIIAAQAASFGIAHIAGFPSGAIGVLLAAVYGALLGLLRARSNGILAPFFAHVGADAVIYGLVLASALGHLP